MVIVKKTIQVVRRVFACYTHFKASRILQNLRLLYHNYRAVKAKRYQLRTTNDFIRRSVRYAVVAKSASLGGFSHKARKIIANFVQNHMI
jgi:hypothetical protein